MAPSRGTAVAIALLLAALAAAGCGLGPGSGVGSVELTVSRDFGAVPMLRRSVEANESDTVMRVLEGSARISTRYGGGFVQSIDGLEAAQRDGRPHDWFFYVDGNESPVGAADYSLRGGERIWWDYRDWSATDHVPAVVGSWPAPFAHGYEGREHPVVVECEGGGGACGKVRRALAKAGAEVAGGASGGDRGQASSANPGNQAGASAADPPGAIRVLVGPWARVRSDSAAAQVEAGPEESGVFASFDRVGGAYRLTGLDAGGDPALRFGTAAGLVAATRRFDGPPVWLVTGATMPGVRAAAGLLDGAKLRDHYAVATEDGKETPLPVGAAAGG